MRLLVVVRGRSTTYVNADPYLEALRGFAHELPAGARAFATDPLHYSWFGRRCTKDLTFAGLSFGGDHDDSWVEAKFVHDYQKHDEDLLIRYRGVRSVTLDVDGDGRWEENRVLLDEILPDVGGCFHEFAFSRGGTLLLRCADLEARWIPPASTR